MRCRAEPYFPTHSLQAFLNKKQGISAFYANLVQRAVPPRHQLMTVYNLNLEKGGSTSTLVAKALRLDWGEVRLPRLL
jgi:hypothetical protein